MNWGGKRLGAGRPKKEETIPVRVPVSQIMAIKNFIATGQTLSLPLYSGKVAAGFPSPADDYLETTLDLNHYLIKHPAATFLVRAIGDSMINAGIHCGDILIVDKSLEATSGKIVIAAINGELTVKRLVKTANTIKLLPENPIYKPIDISDMADLVIWGVVTHVIHQT